MDLPDTAGTTHMDDNADDSIATGEATDTFNCADTRDPDDPTNMADLTDAAIYQQIMTAYPDEGHSGEAPPLAQHNSVELHMPPPMPPIQCNGGDFDPHPLLALAIDCFSPNAGAPTSQEALGSSTWALFQSQCNWEVACWAKLRGPTSSAFTDLLAIPEVIDRLGLSYRNAKELNSIIDKELPGCPSFMCRDLVIGGKTLHFYHRDIIQCIWALYDNPEFAHNLIFAPEHHYTNSERTCQIYSDMHTGEWWWEVQTTLKSCQPGATVIPLMLSRNKAAYPVYITIVSKLGGMASKAAQCCALANIFHSCMQTIVALITSCGDIGITMMSSNGTWHWCHPIFAAFVGDYPEQSLVTCTYSGQCPKCIAPPDQLGEYLRFPLHNYDKALETFLLADGEVHTFHAACHDTGIKPVFHPFWEHLPLSNIFLSIMPDILHQMLQGVMKHLVAWLTHYAAFGPDKIDARTFSNGIMTLSQVSGQEHKDICRIILGLIIDLPLPSGQVTSCIVRTVCTLLDFLYLAQLPSQTTNTMLWLQESLALFHQNKAVFLDLGVQKHFNIPKIHALMHYTTSFSLFGAADNYNTEQTERIHIDLTKDTFRATNHKDEYPQMTTWVEGREKVQQHAAFINPRIVKMAQNPSIKAVSFEDIAGKYGAIEFHNVLADFIARINHPGASAAALKALAADTLIPFWSVPVFHKIKFMSKSTSKVIDTGSSQGHRIAQVCMVFQLPTRSIPDLFPSLATAPSHLAYVEWFSPIPATPDANSSLYKVSRVMCHGRRQASIIPVQSIISSVHLFPRFGQQMHDNCDVYLMFSN
ncbi:hypothetical protein V8E53_005456 [Lactarius tabidus]